MLRLVKTTTLLRKGTRPHRWRLALTCGCVVERPVARFGVYLRAPNVRAECERQQGCRFYVPPVGIGSAACEVTP